MIPVPYKCCVSPEQFGLALWWATGNDTHVAGVARELLARPLASNAPSPLDRNERDQLFSVLTMYGDTSYVR